MIGRRRYGAFILLFTGTLIPLSLCMLPHVVYAQTHTVQYTSTGFSPQSISVNSGDTITWINEGSEFLEIASDPHPVHTTHPFLNIGVVNPNGGTKSLTVSQTGTFGYHNHLFSSHTGTIVVTTSPTTTPTQTPTATISPPNSVTPTITQIQKEADANDDGNVDGIDYVVWLSHYGQTTALGRHDGDFNSDTLIDGIDYVVWLSNYGQ